MSVNYKGLFIVLGAVLPLLVVSNRSTGQEKATPQEVVQKVQQAANALSQAGEPGLAQFNQKDGPWVWKDTYIFVLDCEKGTMAAHPMMPNLIGKDVMTLTDTRGSKFFPELCQAKSNPSGVWVEYWWQKPGQKEGSRKISYALRAGNTSYVVGAGIYDDKATVEDLEKLISGTK
jgi:cytochrome c